MTILEVQELTKSFGGLKAVENVSFKVRKEEILSLIGPNGAGKSTIFNLICGFYRPDSGLINFKGKNIVGDSPTKICKLGIGRTFQIVKPFNSLTVLQNVMVGAFFGKNRREKKNLTDECVEILRFVDLYSKKESLVDTLTIADKKRLEFARALATGPELLLLDEVMAGLNPVETQHIMEIIKKIREKEITIFLVEHVMRAVMTLSDRVTVISYGKKIAEGKPEEVANNKAVIDAYLGAGTIA